MRIAQVVCHFPPDWGGIATAVIYFSRELERLGHNVTVFSQRYDTGVTPADDDFPFEVVRLKPLMSSGRAAVLPELLRRLNEFDIVHLHYPFYGSAELVALHKFLHPFAKLIISYHMDTRAGGLKGYYFRSYARVVMPIILHLADRITYASHDYIDVSDATRYYRKHAEKFDEVTFGVDLDRFKPGPMRDSGSPKIVLFVGSMTTQGYFKGLENLIRAFARISREDCRLVVVGHGDMEQYYSDLTVTLGVDNIVEFVTNADDRKLIDCYQSCDLLVLPPFNRNEAFGIVLLEAMACAKPVVASNLPGVRAVFEDGKQGLLVEPGDIDDLVEKMLAILTDSEMGRRFGEAGRELVESKYVWSRAAESLEEIYYRA